MGDGAGEAIVVIVSKYRTSWSSVPVVGTHFGVVYNLTAKVVPSVVLEPKILHPPSYILHPASGLVG
jgi:hypothetical protein